MRSSKLRGLKFRRQVPLGPYIVDFVCLEKRLIIESDGGQHNELAQAVYDARRSEWLEQQGFRVIRFWDHEVLNQLDEVKTAIDWALSEL